MSGYSIDRLAAIFNLWLEKYAADPEAFGAVLDADGNPVADYGTNCAEYFLKLEKELSA